MIAICKKREMVQAQKMRSLWALSDAKRDASLSEPHEIRKVCNLSYCESEKQEERKWHLCDIYYPKEEKERYPVIVSVHGGGWFYGDKELYRFYAMHLAEKGFAVVNFNYRLSPEYKYPSGFHDVCRLMDFVKRNALTYQLDFENLYLVGDSAGAQLASQYCVFATSLAYRALFDFENTLETPLPKKIALNCGIYDMKQRMKDDKMLCKWYLPKRMDKKLFASFCNVLDYMNEQFPNTYLMCSVNDSLMDATTAMKEKLEELHLPHRYRVFGEDAKQDGHVFHLNLRSANGEKCNCEEADFFLDKS